MSSKLTKLRVCFRKFFLIWERVGVQWRLHLLIQIFLAIFFLWTQYWIVNQSDQNGIDDIKDQARQTADGLINGLNLLMVTGRISDHASRELLIQKMSMSENVKKLRIIRSDQVNAQYGIGLPSEQQRDDNIVSVLNTGQQMFIREADPSGSSTLRAIIPFVASENFRGTNCLSCHDVKSGSVNGVADIYFDLTRHDASIVEIRERMWTEILFFQILLSLLIAMFVNFQLRRHITVPVKNLQSAITAIDLSGDLSLRVKSENKHPDIDQMAETFNAFLSRLEMATAELLLLAKVVEHSEEAILITDADMNIVFVNEAFTRITGYPQNETIGKKPNILKSGYQSEQFYQQMWGEINSHGCWRGEIHNRKKNGEIYSEWQSIFVVKNKQGQISSYVSIFMDITKRKEAEAHIQYMANHDPLTGLANRNLFFDRLEQAMICAHRASSKVGILFLDLDKFKDVNDVYGHAAGDTLLRIIAERLRTSVREGDTIARQGGDEFIVMLPNIEGVESVAKVASKLLSSISSPVLLEQHQVYVSVSIGIAIYPDDSADLERLLKNADSAMYSAKQNGRNCYQFFTQDMNLEAARRIRLQSRLRRAIENESLELFYQPQFNMNSKEITGVEALLRWHDSEDGYISPAEFIPVAEESGLIVSIGAWVLNEACLAAKEWQNHGLRVMVSVNVSARQFREPEFCACVKRALTQAELVNRPRTSRHLSV
jgi:diguanylate cyclase (GGDEF)-like protein/PAS domain S-box-containing protein